MAAERITLGVTHEITINGDRSWVKFEISKDNDHELLDQGVDDLNDYVQKKVIEIIESTARTVMNYSKEK